MQDLTPITELLKQDANVEFAYLFGSQSRGQANPRSDIDIAVYLRQGSDPTEGKVNIIGQFINHLGTQRFDLVILNTAPLPLAARIIRSRTVLVDRSPFLRHRFESLILREYFDFSVREESILNRRFALG